MIQRRIVELGSKCTLLAGFFVLSGCLPSGEPFEATANATAGNSISAVLPTPTPSPTPPPEPPRASNAPTHSVCANGQKSPGVDVSNYDPGIQWSEVQHSGAGFAFIKATEGTTYLSPYFAKDWAASTAAGVLRGAYHFFRASDDPTQQAQFYLQKLGVLGDNDLPAMLDWEVSDGMSAATQIARAKVWLQLVEAATGKIPVIYTGPSFWNSLGNPQGFDRYPLFIAHYDVSCPDVPPPWKTWTFWQTGLGPQTGVSNDADLDVFNGSDADLLSFAKSHVH